MSSKTSRIDGGGTRVTTKRSDGSSTDKTYKSGTLLDISDHKPNGTTKSYNVARGGLLGALGPYRGSRKK